IASWQEGVNSIVVTATDSAGNTTTMTRHVILDSNAPIVAITDSTNGACCGAGSPTTIPLSVSVDDGNPSDVTGALVGSLPAGGGTLTSTFDLQEGANVISVTASGRGHAATATIAVTLDTIPPAVAITSPDD